MKKSLTTYLLAAALVAFAFAFAPVKEQFTQAEQQQISIETPGLFARSNAFSVDFATLKPKEYAFPLPVGRAEMASGNSELIISTVRGDAVKAMFAGTVRLSRRYNDGVNVIVIRHDNGLETVYGNNAQNLVTVGQRVEAGQTIAIVDEREGKIFCRFALMVNGARINPETILEIGSHRLRRETVVFRKNGSRVNVTVNSRKRKSETFSLDPDDVKDDPFESSSTFRLNLANIAENHWAYPLPGSHVISPYGGKRRHAGVDIKTKPNDEIVAAFDGVVTQSGRNYGYGNCITLRHAYGFETLYSHQSRNFVKVGQKVKAGQVIGLTGRTGRATTEHLHFEVHFRGHRYNPNVLFNHDTKRLQNITLVLSKNGNIKSEHNQ